MSFKHLKELIEDAKDSLCPECNGRGWVLSYYGNAGSFTASLQQCPERCNIVGYSKEVQRRLNDPNYVTPDGGVFRGTKPKEKLRPKLYLVVAAPLNTVDQRPKPSEIDGGANGSV